MSTFPIRALHGPAFPSFARVLFFIGVVFDVFAEAQEMARAAHKRYPFVEG